MDSGTCVAGESAGLVSRPVALFVLIFVFALGIWVGRGSVLLETRARMRALDEAVGKIVQGVVGGVVTGLGTRERVSLQRTETTSTDAVTPIIEGVLAGLATAERASLSPSRMDFAPMNSSPSPSSRRSQRERSRDLERARAEADAAEQAMARAEAVVAAAAAASAAERLAQTTPEPRRPLHDDDDSEEDEELPSMSRVESREEMEDTGTDDGEVLTEEPTEMDVDASMEDAFWPEENIEEQPLPEEPLFDEPLSIEPSEALSTEPASTSGQNIIPEVDEGYFGVDAPVEAVETVQADDETQDETSEETRVEVEAVQPEDGPLDGPETEGKPEAVTEPEPLEPEPEPSSQPVPSAPEPESPTRVAAAAAHEAQRAAEIERQRNAAKAAKKAAKSERLVTERMTAHRKDIEQAEIRASEMDGARSEAQRFLKNSGVHALAAAGCMGASLLKLGLLDVTPAELSAMPGNKVENAYKKALAKNHPDRSAARGDDVAAAARCEETFKLLQAAHARWAEIGKPVGNVAEIRVRQMLTPASPSFATGNGSPGYHSPGFISRRTQVAAAAAASAAAAAAAAAGNGAGRSWRPGEASQSSAGSSNNSADYRDAFRDRARRSAAAAADALRREEERVAAEVAAGRERENMRRRAEEEQRRFEAERARIATELNENEELNERESRNHEESVDREGRMRSPVRNARRPPTREEREREIERNMDKL